MARVLTPLGEKMLDSVPFYYSAEPLLAAVFNATAREADRLVSTCNAIRLHFFAQHADDTYGLLSLLERTLGLPVAPLGRTILERRNSVLARLQGRNSGAGSEWVDAMNQAMGLTVWTYVEGPGSYQVTIYFPWSATSYSAIEVQRFAREITPAHLEVAVVFNQGFIVGEGRVGEDRL